MDVDKDYPRFFQKKSQRRKKISDVGDHPLAMKQVAQRAFDLCYRNRAAEICKTYWNNSLMEESPRELIVDVEYHFFWRGGRRLSKPDKFIVEVRWDNSPHAVVTWMEILEEKHQWSKYGCAFVEMPKDN